MMTKNRLTQLLGASGLLLLIATAISCGVLEVQATTILGRSFQVIASVVVIVIIAVSAVVLYTMRKRQPGLYTIS
jgi:hypothetical protein